MRALRRPDDAARIEIMPLIDVIFLLLTFFIYAMVLMVRAELLPIEVPELRSGEAAESSGRLTITIDRDGRFYLNGEPVALESVLTRIDAQQTTPPTNEVWLAADVNSPSGAMFALWDTLRPAGLDVKLYAQPADDTGGPADAGNGRRCRPLSRVRRRSGPVWSGGLVGVPRSIAH